MAITPQQQANIDRLTAKRIRAKIQEIFGKQANIQNVLSSLLANKTPEEADYISTPISEYNASHHEISKYNPDLLALSKKYDALVAEHNAMDNDIINLDDARAQMEAAVSGQKAAVNKSADESTKSNALQKAIQVGAAQGTAGNQ